ncbi:hypothetical protein [Streptococcus pyogenes]|uniref:hypothetical protein n=1 Tax=Streptococcus pyogenes TaxID=1314 RepID=UPI0032047027
MKKKILGLLVLALSAIFLVACSNNSLNGKYYKVYDGEKTLVLEIKDDSGTYHNEGNFVVTNIDTKSKNFVLEGGTAKYTVLYDVKSDGELNVDLGNFYYNASGKETYYKENSKALEKALKDKE